MKIHEKRKKPLDPLLDQMSIVYLRARNYFSLQSIRQTIIQNPNEQGQGLVEYALILVLVAIVVIIVLALLGPVIRDMFGYIRCVIDTRDVPYCDDYFREHSVH